MSNSPKTDPEKQQFYLSRIEAALNKIGGELSIIKDQMPKEEIQDQLSRITKSDESYYITMGYVFQLAHSAYDLFISSEMEERRQIVNLVFQNMSMNGEKLNYIIVQPSTYFKI